MGIMWTGSGARVESIPPGQKEHFDNTLCYLLWPEKNVTYTALQFAFHAHLLVRGGTSPLGLLEAGLREWLKRELKVAAFATDACLRSSYLQGRRRD